MVRKNRTDMPFCVCPRCSRSTSVGKLYGGNKILYYCKDCYIEFSVEPQKNDTATCSIHYSYGARITPERFKWVKSREAWKRVSKTTQKTKKVQ